MVSIHSFHDRDLHYGTLRLLVLPVLVEHLEQLLGGIINAKFEEADPYQSFRPDPYRDRKKFVYSSFKTYAVKVTEEVGSAHIHRHALHHLPHAPHGFLCFYLFYCCILTDMPNGISTFLRVYQHPGHAIAEIML